jgi:hypothetical protein
MARKPAHPDKQLFDYLSGALDGQAAQTVEEHLASCSECGSAAELVRLLKSARQISPDQHPDAGEIAAVFYGKSTRARAETAAHIAICRSCASEIGEYARAEAAASKYNPAKHTPGQVPAAAWEMIGEWEDSSFAKPKPANEVIGHELLAKLFNILGQRKVWLREARRTTATGAAGASTQKGVPVIVVDRSGQLRSVEMFEKVIDATGADVLRHAEKSDRFDEKTVHVLHDADGGQRVASYRVRFDSIRIDEGGADEETTDYFIIED